MHDADLMCSSLKRRMDLDRLSHDFDRSGILCIDPAKDLHQRRFSCTIFSHQCTDLTTVQLQIDSLQNRHLKKGLVDSVHF